MLYHLLQLPALRDLPGMGLVPAITFRTAAASLSALALSLLLGPWFIERLRRFQIGQVVRQDGPSSHKAKAGTPTMGGLLDSHRGLRADAALGEPDESVRLDRDSVHGRLRRDWLRGRLSQDHAAQPSRAVRALQAALAGDRVDRRRAGAGVARAPRRLQPTTCG